MKSFFLFLLAGLLEIAGGYLVWLWLREKQSLGFGITGFVFLAIYGLVPVFQPNHQSFGRVYAAYGAVFIALSMLWGWAIDGKPPDTQDLLGVGIALLGSLIMLFPRSHSFNFP
jgi:small multidrug resistance family-3 protein